jgi:hypothetical protein
MSTLNRYQLLGAVLDHQHDLGLTPRDLVTLVALWTFDNPKAQGCIPGRFTLAKRSGQAPRNLDRTLARFEKKGWLRIEERKGTSNRYHLDGLWAGVLKVRETHGDQAAQGEQAESHGEQPPSITMSNTLHHGDEPISVIPKGDLSEPERQDKQTPSAGSGLTPSSEKTCRGCHKPSKFWWYEDETVCLRCSKKDDLPPHLCKRCKEIPVPGPSSTCRVCAQKISKAQDEELRERTEVVRRTYPRCPGKDCQVAFDPKTGGEWFMLGPKEPETPLSDKKCIKHIQEDFRAEREHQDRLKLLKCPPTSDPGLWAKVIDGLRAMDEPPSRVDRITYQRWEAVRVEAGLPTIESNEEWENIFS